MMRMLNAIKRVCLACPPRLGMHIGECDHACNMINNYVCVCVWFCVCAVLNVAFPGMSRLRDKHLGLLQKLAS